MSNLNSTNINTSTSSNDYSRLYKCLAGYDITTLADKITATKNAQENILSLKKRVSNNDIATA